ncbi:MAG: helix-turn-helix domain-containing protein, partial [Phycisphaeraceae bacterium]|nr:helix-turn-helix domain-containing protein [Phycisphaeraceae bacterium]
MDVAGDPTPGHQSAASAQHSGFRACKRCHPDATPGSPDWNVRQNVVVRAMRLIADGVVERDGVGGIAIRLGYSERHLNRLVTDEVGAGPLSIARSQRAQTSRVLIETTDLALTDVAFAAGFGSVRQFNDTINAVFDATPTALRRSARSRRSVAIDVGAAATVTLRLPSRQPFAGPEVPEFLGRRAISGVETFGLVDGVPTYRRVVRLPNGHGVVSLAIAPNADHVVAGVRVDDWSDLTTAVQRVRRMLDLDADPVAVDGHLGVDPLLGPFVRAVPGRRSPGSVDSFESLVRAIIGQQISVAGARTVATKLVGAVGT